MLKTIYFYFYFRGAMVDSICVCVERVHSTHCTYMFVLRTYCTRISTWFWFFEFFENWGRFFNFSVNLGQIFKISSNFSEVCSKSVCIEVCNYCIQSRYQRYSTHRIMVGITEIKEKQSISLVNGSKLRTRVKQNIWSYNSIGPDE